MDKTHDLTVGPISFHMRRIAIPGMIGSFFITMYNIIDGVWAGKIGIERSQINSLGDFFTQTGDVKGLSALSVTFPIFLIIVGLSIGISAATVALVGNELGKRNPEAAKRYLTQAFVYGFLVSFLVWLIIPFLDVFFYLVGLEDPEVIRYAKEYIKVILYGNVFFCFGEICRAGLVSRGETRTHRNLAVISCLLNMVLDPVFMYGWGPIPAMGLSGIALVSVFLQAVGTVLMLFRLMKFKVFEGVDITYFYPNWKLLRTIAQQSFPPMLNLGMVAFLMGLVNSYALTFEGAVGAAAYGVGLRIEQVALIPSLGIQMAISSIASQNNGAQQIDRIRELYQFSLVVGLVVLLVVMMPIAYLFPRPIIMLFTAEPETIEIAVYYLRVCSFTFYAYLLIIFSGSVFQALKVPHFLNFITLGRNCVLPFLTFYLFSTVFDMGLRGVWFGILFNNWLSALCAVGLYFYCMKRRENEIRRLRRSDG